MKLAVASLIALLALTVTSVAQGAQRYAAPAGSGTACSQAAPCELKEAITKAKAGDEVIVTAGSYKVTATAAVGAIDVHIHGDFGAPAPKLEASISGNAPISPNLGTRLSHLEISNNAATVPIAIYCTLNGSVDRVRASATGSASYGVSTFGNCTVRDSVVRASGTKATAISASGGGTYSAGLVRNVTAIATGAESIGVRSSYNEIIIPGSYTLDLKNAIVAGDSSDLNAANSPWGPGNIVVSHSNFDVATATAPAKITASDNQTAPPAFVDAANGDYRQAAGSPTIDAGSTDQIGPLDLDGNARNLGAAPDIGAYEFVPASPAAPVIESLALSAKSFRTVNAGGAIVSRTRRPKVPVGTTVTDSLSAAGTVSFGVERAAKGRRVGKKCRKATRANRKRKKCVLYQKVKGGFSHTGAAGQNRFKFSGRINGKALKPGRYRLVGSVGESVRRAGFKIVR